MFFQSSQSRRGIDKVIALKNIRLLTTEVWLMHFDPEQKINVWDYCVGIVYWKNLHGNEGGYWYIPANPTRFNYLEDARKHYAKLYPSSVDEDTVDEDTVDIEG